VDLNPKNSKRKIADAILKCAWFAFAAAALYHLLAIFIALNNSTGWHNGLFVIINLWCAFEIGRARLYFVIIFTGLYIQQVISHGNSIFRSMNENKLDWLSILVLISITIIYIALIWAFRARYRETFHNVH